MLANLANSREHGIRNGGWSYDGVAASWGLSGIRRFYREKYLSDLAHAIAAKNAVRKKRHHEEVMLSLA
jgi:hypothetical protein